MRALRMARVSYSPTEAYEVGAAIGTWAATGGSLPERGPGLTQGNAVAFAVHLTVLQGICKAGTTIPQQAACFKGGTLMGVRPWSQRAHGPADTFLPIYGQESQRKPRFGSGQLGAVWSRDLALALGCILRRLATAEMGPQVVQQYAIPTTRTALLTVIVAGPAVRIMWNVATWRYLDSPLIQGIGYVGAAASAFETRLRASENSGVEIPPTPIELAAADEVRAWARPDYNRCAIIGGSVVGGLTIGVPAVSAIRSAASA